MTKFKKGQSGNPSGRPKQESARIREQLNQHSDEIVSILMDKVRDGDTTALKMALDRISPSLKPTTPQLELEAAGNSLQALSEAVKSGLVAGRFDSEQVKTLVTALQGLARVDEVTELAKRLEAMEALLTNK